MLCLVRRKLIFEKYFFAFMSVWSDGKCWLTRNYFPVDCKIKTFMIEIDLRFHFLFHPKLINRTTTTHPPLSATPTTDPQLLFFNLFFFFVKYKLGK